METTAKPAPASPHAASAHAASTEAVAATASASDADASLHPQARPTLITGCLVVDGSGTPGYLADIELRDGRICRIGEPGTLASDHEQRGATHPETDMLLIDGRDKVLSPGFIDMHAHSDVQLLATPEHWAKLNQGVTTEVLGQDGLSYAPVNDETLPAIRAQIAGWNDDPAGFDYSWRTVGEYLDRLDQPDGDGQRIAANAAYLIPQGTVRAFAMGFDERPPTAEEMERMRAAVRDGMREGAFGLSSGLTYTPGMYASTEELAELLTVVAEHDGYYSPHHRSYGKDAIAAYQEMIDLARSTGCALHLAHATLNFRPNAGRAPELIAVLDDALDSGVDLTLDTYPYCPGNTTLAALLPSWATAGGTEATLERLTDASCRARIRYEMEVTGADGSHGVPAEWDTLEVSGVQNPELQDRVGLRISEIANMTGKEPFDAFADLIVEDRCGTGVLQHVGHEENVRAIMQHRAHTGGSDGILVGGKPHPRAWGTFPRFLGHYTRELGLLSLEDMVHHLSGKAAARLGLADRGLIKPGYWADLVLFDPETIEERATFDEPRQSSTGIDYVFVNGAVAAEHGKPTGVRAGRALRKPTRERPADATPGSRPSVYPAQPVATDSAPTAGKDD